MINFQIQSKFKLTQRRKIKKWLNDIAEKEEFEIGVLNYLFVNDDKMCEYNKKYLNHNSLTDVITFLKSNQNSDAQYAVNLSI